MQKSSDEIEIGKIYDQILKEDLTAGGVYGDVSAPVGIENSDSYAPGDMRNPYGLGITTRKGKLKTMKKRPKKKKSASWDGSIG